MIYSPPPSPGKAPLKFVANLEPRTVTDPISGLEKTDTVFNPNAHVYFTIEARWRVEVVGWIGHDVSRMFDHFFA